MANFEDETHSWYFCAVPSEGACVSFELVYILLPFAFSEPGTAGISDRSQSF